MPELYDFHKLKEELIRLGYQVGEANPFTPHMEDLDLSQIKELKYIDPQEGGGIKIVGKDGREYIGGVIKKTYYHSYPDKRTGEIRISDPRIHLCNCDTIHKIGQDAYRHMNSIPAFYIDSSDGNREREFEEYKICANCRKILLDGGIEYDDYTDFIDQMREKYGSVGQTDAVDVDINGYTRDWQRVSKNYREKKEYCCEKCGWQPKNNLDRRYIQVHHKSGIKTDNSERNLICLCIKCHSEVDDTHRQNFSTGGNKSQLDAFKKLLDNEENTK